MAAYSSIRVLPVAYGEKNGEVGSYCDENDADKCTGQAIKSYVGIEIKDVGSIKHLLKSETLSMSQGSNSKADNCCDSIEQVIVVYLMRKSNLMLSCFHANSSL